MKLRILGCNYCRADCLKLPHLLIMIGLMQCPYCESDKVYPSVSGTAALGWVIRWFIVVNRCHTCSRTFPQRKLLLRKWLHILFGWSSYTSDDSTPLSTEHDIRLMRLVETLFENLRITLLATVVCFFGGLVLSVPANFVIDPGASSNVWFRRPISSPERVMLHRQRTTTLAIFSAVVGLVASQSAFWMVEFGSRSAPQSDALPSAEGVAAIGQQPTTEATTQATSDDEEIEPAPCISCGAVIPSGADACPACDWSYASSNVDAIS